LLKKLLPTSACKAAKKKFGEVGLRTNVDRQNLLGGMGSGIFADCLEGETGFARPALVVPKSAPHDEASK
jgi:hypothetical protein